MTLSSNLENHDSFRGLIQDGLHQLQIGIDSIADVAAAERLGRALMSHSCYCERS